MDIKKMIVEELKAEGKEIAEETAKSAVKALFRVIPKAAAATENKYDDLLVPVIAVLEPKVMELLEGINKEDNE